MSDPHANHHPSSADSHGHAAEALGPIDLAMWGLGILGAALGLLVVLCCAFAVGML